jgi:predicted negative regulator of RcsB-dependent stress response
MAKPKTPPSTNSLGKDEDFLETAAHWVQTNGKAIAIGAVVVAAVGLGVYGVRASDEKKRINASQALADAQMKLFVGEPDSAVPALVAVADRYRGTSAGEQALLLAVRAEYESGKFDAGIKRLEEARKGASPAFAASMDGLAAAGYEGLSQFEKAAEFWARAAAAAKGDEARRGFELAQARNLARAGKTAEAETIFSALVKADTVTSVTQEAALRLGELRAAKP